MALLVSLLYRWLHFAIAEAKKVDTSQCIKLSPNKQNCVVFAVASGGCKHISAAPLSSFIPLWCLRWWAWSCPCSATDLLHFVWNANMNYLLLFCFFISHRAKPAASSNSNSNSNDAGGVDEPDLEKMKQVFYFLRLHIRKNGFLSLFASVVSHQHCENLFYYQF